jgi:hypothetical protein
MMSEYYQVYVAKYGIYPSVLRILNYWYEVYTIAQ